MQSPTIFQLFFSFLRLGLTAFGGPAMVSYIGELSVKKKQWIDEESFRHGVALCQTLPGAIAVNAAAYVGLTTRGIPGMLVSFAGFLLPAFLILLTFSAIYHETRSLPAMVSVFKGLQVIVVAIIANATLSFGRNIVQEKKNLVVAVASALVLLLNVNPFVVIVGAALAGWVLYDIQGVKFAHPPPDSPWHFKSALALLGAFLAALLLLFFIDTTLFDLAFVMAKIELFAFGGGYTALTLMYHEVVEARAWLDNSVFMDGVALGQVTPGPILINATFIGYLLKGISGAVIGTLAIFLPCMILMAAAVPFFDRLRSSSLFLRAVKGIVTCFVGLLFFITIKFAADIPWDVRRTLLCAVSFTAIYLKVDILYVVLAGAIVSAFIL